ncbi:MAG: sigma-70 family RNA polymerase sigma factor [Acidobacteria bacterium]|nr:sigma-70 family RNA polymerase sigma factor [Acidobacteriota bacterium]
MPNDVTELLIRLSEGNENAVNEIFPLIYKELKLLAGSYLKNERVNHTLQPTALVHEAYLRLIDHTRMNWQNRAHFVGMAATIMRQILIDHARRHRARKRGGAEENLQLDESIVIVSDEKSVDLLALDEALKELAKFDEFKSRLVELRYFGGLSVEETATVLGVSEITVKRHWRLAKAFLAETIQV